MGCAEEWVAGPRGRRLCFSAVAGRRFTWPGASPRAIVDLLQDREDEVAALAGWGEAALLEPLADSVDRAMYWQEPDEIDQALAAAEVGPALLPAARALASAPGSQWWSSPVALGHQVAVTTRPGEVPAIRPVGEVLADWRA